MNKKRIGIIGVGNVGSTLAYLLALKNLYSNILLKDLRENIVEAIALDISQAAKAAKSKTVVTAIHDNKFFTNCNVIVITAGVTRKPDMSRDDLLLINTKIMTEIINDVTTSNPNAIIIIVSNPLDAMVYCALKTSKWPRNKIIGMGGILDSSRMSHFIQEKLDFIAEDISSQVMGGHGDDMVPLTNFSTINGKPLNELLSVHEINEIIDKTKQGGLEIIQLLKEGSAYYAPAFSTLLMVEAILLDTKNIYPCSVMLEGEYGYHDIVAGIPVQLGRNGIEEIVELNLNDEQKNNFSKSVLSVKNLIDKIKQ